MTKEEFESKRQLGDKLSRICRSGAGLRGKIPQPVQQPVQPIPREDWPVWAKALAQFAKPEDKGIGDIVARVIGDENSAKFKAWHLATFGKPCNCNARQARWNAIYPL